MQLSSLSTHFSEAVFSIIIIIIHYLLFTIVHYFVYTHTHTHTHTHTKVTLTSGCYGPTDHHPMAHPTSLASFSLRSVTFCALDGSLFHPSVYFSVINITLWSPLFDELPVDIRPPHVRH